MTLRNLRNLPAVATAAGWVVPPTLGLCLHWASGPQGWSSPGSGVSGLGPPGPLDRAAVVTPDARSIPTPGAAQGFFKLEHTGVCFEFTC